MKCPTCGQETKVQERPILQKKDVMVYIAGSKHAFRCSCGGNVFRKFEDPDDDSLHYQCNGCEALYEGEK